MTKSFSDENPEGMNSISLLDELISAKNEAYSINQQYNELYNYSPCCYFTLDHRYIIQAANLASASLVGADKSTFMHQSFLNFIEADSKLMFQSHIDTIFSSKQRECCEIELILKEDQRCQAHIESIYLENHLVLITVVDITHRKQLEFNVNESRKSLYLLENIFQNSSNAKAVLDLDFNFINLNNAFIQSFSTLFGGTKVYIGMNFLKILADFPELKTRIQAACDQVWTDKHTFITIEIDTQENGLPFHYEVHFKQLNDSQLNKTLGLMMLIKKSVD